MGARSEIINTVKEEQIIAIVRGVEEKKALKIARALYEGGIKLIEVTFNTQGAEKMIRAIKREMGEKIYVGAGTVLDAETARQAITAGAEYILSPSLNKDMVDTCNIYGKVAVPGIATPSEALKAMQVGADLIKFFPAAASGADYMRSIRGPLDQVEIIAVGGINLNNASVFLENGAVALGIGSSLVDKKMVAENDFSGLRKKASQFKALTE